MEFRKFDKDSRSNFSYWFWHWLAYNYVAMKLGVWHPRFLLHDIEKPWLMILFRNDYSRVQKWHRYHRKHHTSYGRRYGMNKVDWLGVIIDWECSRYTKNAAQKTAREETDYLVNESAMSEYEKDEIRRNCYLILDHLGI